ncbi:MAG: L-threonylcarbamoyladenylate synthase [Caldiserica bacterium]|nr:L-threonylcarbamoyladenylate synthase [Caldisericota bacterium]
MSPPEIVLLDACSDADVRRLSERIVAGAVTVFPTDTVYGIGCNAACAASVARVFSAKHRDSHKPLPVFISDIVRFLPWVDPAVRGMAEHLAKAFWPGALTIVVNVVGSGIHTQPPPYPEASSIGFRVPRHAGLHRLLTHGLVMAQTSLNESGKTVIECLEAPGAVSLLEQADLVLDSRERPEGRPSTVVGLAPGSWTMLREGAISFADVTSALVGEAL